MGAEKGDLEFFRYTVNPNNFIRKGSRKSLNESQTANELLRNMKVESKFWKPCLLSKEINF